MPRPKDILLKLSDPILPEDLKDLDGKTFQVHVYDHSKICLVSVRLIDERPRCPVIVGGEQCGMKAGHEGKHMWANGD